MPAYFPGMDPFLEAHWGDVHASLIIYARNQIQGHLPSGLVAGIEQYVALEIDDEVYRFRPDASVMRSEPGGTALAEAPVGVALAEADEPCYIDEVETQRRIRIEDSHGRLVTRIEFLSPSNKRSAADRDQFHRKQVGLLQRGVNLVEIDLLVEGVWTVYVKEELTPKKCRYPYRICVIRGERPDRYECYPAPLQRALPRIRIPLRPSDQDVVLNLQSLVTQAWEDGAFAKRINYSHDELPPLSAEDTTWVTEELAGHGVTRTGIQA